MMLVEDYAPRRRGERVRGYTVLLPSSVRPGAGVRPGVDRRGARH